MTDLDRDLVVERALTSAAGNDQPVAALELSEFAEDRAGTGPVVDVEQRDFALEALEELADARNYLVWLARLHAGHPATVRLVDAIGALVHAYAEVNAAAHELAKPPRPIRPALQAAILETGLRFPRCRCQLDPAMTDEQLTALGGGCTAPRWSCPRLDAVRRRTRSNRNPAGREA
jgi:hypothetical protein